MPQEMPCAVKTHECYSPASGAPLLLLRTHLLQKACAKKPRAKNTLQNFNRSWLPTDVCADKHPLFEGQHCDAQDRPETAHTNENIEQQRCMHCIVG